jgi:H+/Cl- antiporter ClcA
VLGVLEAVALGDELSDAVELSRRTRAVCAVVAAAGLAVAFATVIVGGNAFPNKPDWGTHP